MIGLDHPESETQCPLWPCRLKWSIRSAGVANPRVLRGRSLSCRATLLSWVAWHLLLIGELYSRASHPIRGGTGNSCGSFGCSLSTFKECLQIIANNLGLECHAIMEIAAIPQPIEVI